MRKRRIISIEEDLLEREPLPSSMTIWLYAAAGFAQAPTQVATAWKVDVGLPLWP